MRTALALCLACLAAAPAIRDERLQLTLVASDPEIVTPIGLAAAADGRLFVLESHTHSPPRNYAGPRSDRVKVLHLGAGDDKARRVTVFADGIDDGLNVAVAPGGDLYVVTSRSVLRLNDRDGDGVSESRDTVLELLSPQRPYEHAALLGIAFSHDGWLYVSRGNVGSLRYTIRGADGSRVSGYGDGGNIVRCRPDGSGVEEVATGFWNPFGLCFDGAGRLLCADNDPDARGPNRLVHVVPGGDYGYKSAYGGGGNHPYQAWNGELPGTLPFAAALGEAPCGVLDAGSAALPEDYRGVLLCAVWGEHNLTAARLKPRGTSVTADTWTLVEGGQDFRPVALAAGADGAVYFTDWVRRDYPNHGAGRVWRLSAKPGVATMTPRAPFEQPAEDPGLRRLGRTRDAGWEEVAAALRSTDPFLRAAAVDALARPALRGRAVEATRDPDAAVRLGALLALRRAGYADAEPLARRLLGDPDARVRRMALVWAGERGMTGLRDDLRRAVATEDVSADLFETYLATLELLTPEFVEAWQGGKEPHANRLPRRLDPAVVRALAADESAPAALRAVALTRLGPPGDAEDLALLKKLLSAADERLRVEAVRTLAGAARPEAVEALLAAARDRLQPAGVRAEAVAALAPLPADRAHELRPLLADPEQAVAREANRVLRTPAEREDVSRRPASVERWQAALASGGDAASGRRVFFSPAAGCARCHTVNNRGGKVGPDLSRVGASRDRGKLVRDVLRPSDEFSIDYQAWYVKTPAGETHLGLQLDLKDAGAIELFTTEGKTVHFAGDAVAAYGASKQSLMPDGLEAGMTVADFRDLLAFLETRR